jgi:hypothetical protein
MTSHTLLLPLLLTAAVVAWLLSCRDNLEHDLLFWQQLEYVPSVSDLFDQARNNPMISKVCV